MALVFFSDYLAQGCFAMADEPVSVSSPTSSGPGTMRTKYTEVSLSSSHFSAKEIPAVEGRDDVEEEEFFEAENDVNVVEDIGAEDLSEQFEELRVVPEEERDAEKARGLKEKGNTCYQAQDFRGAAECYGLAIKFCPYQYDKEKELAEARRRAWAAQEEEERARKSGEENVATPETGGSGVSGATAPSGTGGKEGTTGSCGGSHQADATRAEEEKEPFAEFKEECAVYYCNRAACWVHLGRDQEVVEDCSVALKLKSGYAKALMRRAQASERLDKLEDALKDYKEVLALDPGNRVVRAKMPGLEKECAARMEKLKTETIGKLKDLGNSVLSNFGLSLDNFKMQQDPNTGSYSFSFQK